MVSTFLTLLLLLVAGALTSGEPVRASTAAEPSQFASRTFRIVKITELGECGAEPMLGLLRFSPDGRWLAFFSPRNELVIADSTGNRFPIRKSSLFPDRFEWASDKQIIVNEIKRTSDSVHERIVLLDVTTRSERVLEEIRTTLRNSRSGGVLFGPKLTNQGKAYYTIKHRDRKSYVLAPEERRADEVPVPQTILEWYGDGLYLVGLDSTQMPRRLADRPVPPEVALLPAQLSPDQKYWIKGGTMQSIADGTCIVLDTMIGPRPNNAPVCGINYELFNPAFPSIGEVIFSLTCDDGHRELSREVRIYDVASNRFTQFDTIPGLNGAYCAVYHPGGRHIALVRDGIVLLVQREEIK